MTRDRMRLPSMTSSWRLMLRTLRRCTPSTSLHSR